MSCIDHIKINEDVFNAWCLCLEPQYKGPFKQSTDVDPITKNKVENDCIYTPAEKKSIRPTKACMDMYAKSNKDAAAVTELLMGDYSRELVHVPVTAYSFCEAFLCQVSHDRYKYKSVELLQQIAFFMVQFPDKCYPIAKKFLEEEDSYESYIKNVYHGTKYIDVEVVTAVITMMWNISINIVYPSKGSVRFYHNEGEPDVVLVNNEMKQPENHFSSTKPTDSRWRPVKGKDWSNQIKVLSNVKNAHTTAEKKLRTRLVNHTVSEFNGVTQKLDEMKDELSLQADKLKSMQDKIQQWSINISKMEGKQGVLRMRLLELGVDVSALKKPGPALEGIHFASVLPLTTSTTPTATVSRAEDLGQPVELETPTTTVEADIHPTPPVDTVTPPTSTTSGSSTASTTSDSSSAPPSTSVGQIVPLSAAQISQLITPGPSAIGGPQQIVNIGGQNVLISGSGPGTVGTSSIRYGKILKGVHKYFCSKCQKPFTQRESLKRHEEENCPKAETKKKYKCDTCGLDKFSSKQYLKEHIHEVHLKTPSCYCRSCGKGFYKHCNLSFHKKSCLAYLHPQQAAPPTGNPQQQPVPPPTGEDTQAEEETDETGQEAADETHQGNPLIGGKTQDEKDAELPDDDDNPQVEFSFADPKSMYLPNL